MNFRIIENGKEIECNIVMTFKDDGNSISYIVYTDGTKDNDGDLELYASRYEVKNGKYILSPIKNDYEWDLVDNMLESIDKEDK